MLSLKFLCIRGGRPVKAHFVEHWDRLLFRDYLIQHDEVAREYETLKRELTSAYPNDRVAYTRGKSAFIDRITARAREQHAF